MRTIEYAAAIKRDFKRLSAGIHRQALINDFPQIVSWLLNDQPLPEQLSDHALKGNWSGYRECHIKPDLLLVYQKSETVLKLARLGSHSELFGG